MPLRKTQDDRHASAAGAGISIRVVERVTFGQADLEPNRLILGDNLSVMRLLSAESVDLIYADPPFFSGRQYQAGRRGEERGEGRGNRKMQDGR